MTNTHIIFPCKSINLAKFLKSKNIYAIHIYTDIKDNKKCWIFLKDEKLINALTEWQNNKK